MLSHHHHQHSLSSHTQFPKLPPHSSTFLLCSPALSLSHSVCLLWDVKEALSLLFICMCCRGLEAEESQTGTVKSLLCVCVYTPKPCVYSIRPQSSQEEHLHRPLVLISPCATLHVNIRHSISILLILSCSLSPVISRAFFGG